MQCVYHLIQLGANLESEAELNDAMGLAGRIFSAFDTDGTGEVDYAALTSGLSVLSTAGMDDKISTAFLLYDVDGDGKVRVC